MQGVLIFEIGERRMGLGLSAVREVLRAVAIAPLPKAPPIVEGVINVRGAVVPVLDIRRRFGMVAAPLSVDHHFVVANAGPRVVALRVDRAIELMMFDDESLEELDGIFAARHHVAGVAKLPDGLLVIHDLETFLDVDEGRRLDSAVSLESAQLDVELRTDA
jgi:purine-binding chemotaxis protein CheW